MNASLTTRRLLRAASATLALSFAAQATAASYQWDVNDSAAGLGGTGAWDTTSAFWDLIGTGSDDGTDTTTAYTFTNADTAVFGGTAGTVTLGTGVTLNGLTFNTTGYTVTGNTLTLAGTTPTINVATGSSTVASIFAGSAGLTKSGNGTLVVTGTNTYTGTTSVSAGTLDVRGGNKSNSVIIASGATLKFTVDSALTFTHNVTFSGSGTMVKAGGNNVTWGSGAATFALGSGALIDVQAGTFTAASSANEVWTNNKADLNVAAGALFDGVEATSVANGGIFVNAITGSGTIKVGWTGTYASKITFGIDNGTGTFNGVLADRAAAGSYVKAGTGTQTLNGVNTYTGTTTISGGTLRIGGSGSLGSGTYAANITNNGAFEFTSSAAQTLSGVISGTGTLTKSTGTAALTLSGNNTYTGATTISSGRLNLTGTNASTITLNSDTTLAGEGSTTGGLTFNAGSTMVVDGSTAGSFNSGGAVNFAGATTLVIDALPITAGAHVVNLVGYGTLSNLVNLSGPTGYRGGTIADDTVNSKVTFNYTAGSRTWNTGAGAWDILTTASWAEDDNLFANGDAVVFNDSGAGGVITLAGTLLAGSVTVDNATSAYTFSGAGALSGATGLTKSNSGTLTIANANTFTGNVTLSGGVLSVSAANNLGTGNIAISNNAILASTATHTLGRRISADSGGATVDVATDTTLTHTNGFLGGNTLTKTGTGTLAFSGYGGSTFASGALVIDAGTVRFNTGAFNTNIGLASITVNNGGTLLSPLGVAHSLGGYGVATPALTINTGGIYQVDREQYLNSVTLAGGQITGASEVRTDNNWAFNVTEDSSMSVRINGVQTDIAINVAADKTFTMSGQIVNSKPLVKNGAGTMLLTNAANTYAGGTTVNAGVLSISADGNLGTVPGTATEGSLVINGGTLTATETFSLASNRGIAVGPASGTGAGTVEVAATKTLTYGGIIANNVSGTGGLTKTGSGTLILTGSNTYDGATNVNQGTLQVDGVQPTADGTTTVAGGAKLQGSGSLGGALTIEGSGIHTAGSGARVVGGQVVGGDLTYASGAVFEWDLGSTGNTFAVDYDAVDVSGNLSIDAATVFKVMNPNALDFTAVFWDSNRTWADIFAVTGTTTSGWSNTGVSLYDSDGTLQDVSAQGYFTVNGTTLNWTAVPEPGSVMAGLLLGAGLLRRRRQRL